MCSFARRTRIVAEAHKDIALLRRTRGDIVAGFDHTGDALTRLNKPEVYLGFKHGSGEVAQHRMDPSKWERVATGWLEGSTA